MKEENVFVLTNENINAAIQNLRENFNSKPLPMMSYAEFENYINKNTHLLAVSVPETKRGYRNIKRKYYDK